MERGDSNRWQFTDIAGEDALADAVDAAQASEAAAQAGADQRLEAPDDAENLDAAKDPDALAAGRPKIDTDSAAFADGPDDLADAGTEGAVFSEIPKQARPDDGAIEGTVVRSATPRPTDAERALGGMAERAHVRILFLGQRDTANVDTAGDLDDEAGEATSDRYDGGPEDGSVEAHHDEHGTHYGIYTAQPDGTLKFEPIDPSELYFDDDDEDRHGDQVDDAEGVDVHDPTEDGSDEASEEEFDEDGNPVVKILDVSWRTVSGAAVTAGSWGLQKYREGPGEKIVESRLRSHAEREGRREVKRLKREAFRKAPLGWKRRRASDIGFQAHSIIRDTAKQVIADTHARWELERLGEFGDSADPAADEKP